MKSLNINELSIEQKLGQMLICRQPLDNADKEFILQLIKNRSLGGIQISNTKDVKVNEILAAAEYPILICENMEYGFGKGEVSLPCPLALGAINSEDIAYEFGRITAIEAVKAGYNVVFGPILDIAMNPLSCCIGPRAFGGDEKTVAKISKAVIQGYQDQGMIVTAKHYPGFGESSVDSHLGMVYLQQGKKELIERELYPYINVIVNANLSGVMVGHIMVPKIDEKYPASLSPKMIGLLREVGFDGLVITDSLAMVGLTNQFGLGECHCLAIEAGVDMVLASYRIPAEESYEFMLNAYKTGRVSEEQINLAVSRVIEAQQKTLINKKQNTISKVEKHIAKCMSAESIVAIVNDVDQCSISTEIKHLFVVQKDNKFINPENNTMEEEFTKLDNIEELIQVIFPKSDIVRINTFPSTQQMENVASKTMEYESIVMIVNSKTDSYTGSSDLTKRLLSLIEAVSNKISAIVSFGNPYAAREYPYVKRIIFGFEGGDCEEAAMKVLSGEEIPKGEMPIDLKLRGKNEV